MQAVYWYQKAAQQGQHHAMYNLGLCYEYGQGINKDLIRAYDYYQQAASQGHQDAKTALTRVQDLIVQNSKTNVPATTEDTKVSTWTAQNTNTKVNKPVVEQSTKPSTSNISNTKSVKQSKNTPVATRYYNNGKSAYERGNYNDAVTYFRKAAEQGASIAQKALANCYLEGHGVSKSKTQALHWYKKAAEQGDEDAKQILKRIK
jgi:TPR repeat protein